jgi:hypothetical protein
MLVCASMSRIDCYFTFHVFVSSRPIEHKPEMMKIDNTEDQYLSINEQFKYTISKDQYMVINDQTSIYNLVHMILKYFNLLLLHIANNSNVSYR